MELKSYQYKVIKDLEAYLEYVQQHKKNDRAFNHFWEDRIGPYNPLNSEGMQPYKNTIANAAHVCIKVPTAGGKTFIACNALHTIFNAYSDTMPRVVVWLVPWSNLLGQTISALSNSDHPYRQKLNSLFNSRVMVYEKKDLLMGANFNPAVVREQLSIIVMSFASLRAKNKADRKVYQENGQLEAFKAGYSNKADLLPDADETSLINVLRSMQPVVVVDESHNAESNLSIDMLNALNPSFVLDLTATPKNNSNIISLVPAIELKKEHMVKLPVIVYNHHDKTDVINSALHLQRKLESLAIEQEKAGGRYIRPIVLFQAQPKTGEENVTYQKVKTLLLSAGIPESQIRIKTATIDEIRGENLMDRNYEVRYIITINALKEGWDCPFAYVLASLADRSSAVDVEQILGRILRQPYVSKHASALLNTSYVLTASAKFNDTLQNIVKGLQAAGFSDKDHRVVETESPQQQPVAYLLDGKPQPALSFAEEEFDMDRISYQPNSSIAIKTGANAVSAIEIMAHKEAEALQQTIVEQQKYPTDDPIFTEMGNMVKRYRMADTVKPYLNNLKLPQFYLTVMQNEIFGTGNQLLSQEPLLHQFKLSNEDTKIDLGQISSDLYKVDIEETGKTDHDARFTKIEDMLMKEPIVAYILSKPPESQVKDIAHQLIKSIGDMYPIPDQEIRAYIERILSSLNTEQLQDILLRKMTYADHIKAKIKQHADNWAEVRFYELIKIGKIKAEKSWLFKDAIVPGPLGPSISRSLYEREGMMNNFEISVITKISALPNIIFWHRNLGRGKGFNINGYKFNHYPDFIVATRSGKIILIETKGDDRDNSDSMAKCRLGNKWADMAGDGFNYFMVFDKNAIDGAFNTDHALTLIGQL